MTTPASIGRPAIDGGEPVRRDPMPPRIQVDERELEALDKVFRRRMTDGGAFDRYDGPEVDDYEAELAAYFGVKHVTCVSAGTAAIHSAIGALDLEPGCEVIVSSFTDPGSVMPLLFNGLVPVFAEHDYDTFLMSPAGVRAAITPYTRAIIVAQIHGYVADMEAIGAIAREHDLTVIGDCSAGPRLDGGRVAQGAVRRHRRDEPDVRASTWSPGARAAWSRATTRRSTGRPSASRTAASRSARRPRRTPGSASTTACTSSRRRWAASS